MPVILIPPAALALFNQALVGALSAVGGKVATLALLDPLTKRVTKFRTTAAINKAFTSAIEQFAQTAGNAPLLAALEANPVFWEDKGLHETLATAMVYPERRHDCRDDLERRFGQIAPSLLPAPHLLRNAARCLLTAMGDNVLKVTTFTQGLEELRESVRAGANFSTGRGRSGWWRSLPHLAPGLEAELTRLAEDEALICGHNYVSAAHLLLAFADRPGSAAAGVLEDADLTPDILRPVVADVIKWRGSKDKPARRPLPASESVRHAFRLAREGAQREELSEAEDEQVLEALLDMADLGREEGKSVAETLSKLGMPTEKLRAPLNQFLSVVRTLSLR